MNADGTGLVTLTDTRDNSNTAWSPCGTRTAFRRMVIIRDGSGNEIGREDGIYTIGADSSGVTSLNSPGAFDPDC